MMFCVPSLAGPLGRHTRLDHPLADAPDGGFGPPGAFTPRRVGVGQHQTAIALGREYRSGHRLPGVRQPDTSGLARMDSQGALNPRIQVALPP